MWCVWLSAGQIVAEDVMCMLVCCENLHIAACTALCSDPASGLARSFDLRICLAFSEGLAVAPPVAGLLAVRLF